MEPLEVDGFLWGVLSLATVGEGLYWPVGGERVYTGPLGDNYTAEEGYLNRHPSDSTRPQAGTVIRVRCCWDVIRPNNFAYSFIAFQLEIA